MNPIEGHKATIDPTKITSVATKKTMKDFGITPKTQGIVLNNYYIKGKLAQCRVRFPVSKAVQKKRKKAKLFVSDFLTMAFNGIQLQTGVLKTIYTPRRHPLTTFFKHK